MALQVDLQRVGFDENVFRADLQRVVFGGVGAFRLDLQQVIFGGASYSLSASNPEPESGETVVLSLASGLPGTVVWRIVSIQNGVTPPQIVGSGLSVSLIMPAVRTATQVVVGAKQGSAVEQTATLTIAPADFYTRIAGVLKPTPIHLKAA